MIPQPFVELVTESGIGPLAMLIGCAVILLIMGCFMDGVHPTHNVQSAYGWIKKGVRKEIPANTGRARVNLSGVVDVIAEALTPLSEKIDLAFIYGSIAQGRETAGSDLDLLVIGKAGYKEIVAAVYDLQDRLQREINPKVYKKGEWMRLLKSKDGFAREVMAGPKLLIQGSYDEFG